MLVENIRDYVELDLRNIGGLNWTFNSIQFIYRCH